MIKTRESLTSLLVGAGVAMVAITSLATVAVTVALHSNGAGSLGNFLLMIASSGCATIFVFSHLHLELKKREKQSLSEARMDPLSGLPNRKAMIEALDRIILEQECVGTSACLALLDLNNFKNVNDTLGHEMGDKLLMQIADRLRAALPSDQIFRLGGDEFALIFEGRTLEEAENDCCNLHHKIADTYALGETRAGIGCSLGIAQVETNLTPSDLIRRADLAMYKAKKSRTFVEVFDQAMLLESVRKSELAARLRAALEDGTDISLKYQPIISRDKRIVALEVYFRWYDKEFGEVPPQEAVQIARLTQQIDNLSLYVAVKAIEVLNRIPGIMMCINVEAMQILDTRFSEALDDLIKSNGLHCSRFQLEIDGSEIVAYGRKIAPVLRGLADCGFSIAVDNYGSSASSLTELSSMGVTAIKFDNSILHSARSSKNISLMRAKVNLASTLGLKVTCKGIGDQHDEAIALQAGCDYLQGFKYGRPDSAGAIFDQSEHIVLSANG